MINAGQNNGSFLTQEQMVFITKAIEGHNIFVDACIGSGKTTAIQYLCSVLPTTYNVLYLTYNRLLKIDAQARITNPNVTVTNYHGFASAVLNSFGYNVGVLDLIQTFNKIKPRLRHYDVLVLDEYQDIDLELSLMLGHIKASNPGLQIIVVGDYEQKIYDKTELDVLDFLDKFLGNNYICLEFTRCFRLPAEYAQKLGRIWDKKIIGTNDNCSIQEMTTQEIISFLSHQSPRNILCLGSRDGKLSYVLNALETRYSDTYNKNTVFASIRDNDSFSKTSPDNNTAIFTTFDSSKGLERDICVVFDYTEEYWNNRSFFPDQKYEILRNIFCVAASRGKSRIIFANDNEEPLLSEKTIMTKFDSTSNYKNVSISTMFDFRYKENIEECYSHLYINQLHTKDNSFIFIKSNDGLIDLSPCIGIYQEASFFNGYDIDKELKLRAELYKKGDIIEKSKNLSLEEKVLLLTSLDTKQDRYVRQVTIPFISPNGKKRLHERLNSRLSKDETVQVPCEIKFSMSEKGEYAFSAKGYADVVKNHTVYELKYVTTLTHEHFLQCACYIAALNLPQGILWNTRNNQLFQIIIKDTPKFLDCVTKTITKSSITKHYSPQTEHPPFAQFFSHTTEKRQNPVNSVSSNHNKMDTPTSPTVSCNRDPFAVIDTETNYDNEIMSIGIVIADSQSFQEIEKKYFIITPAYTKDGWYSDALFLNELSYEISTRSDALRQIHSWLNAKSVSKILAYNAAFDYRLLPELSSFSWYDIMKVAAYKQYNAYLPKNTEYCSTGRLKRDYGVEPILRLLTNDYSYTETHNALLDATDELRLIKNLGHNLSFYDFTCINKK